MAGNPLETLGTLDPEMLDHLKAGDRFVSRTARCPGRSSC